MVSVRVPASTSNLGSGFDTLGLALQLYLHVEMDFSDALSIEYSGEGGENMPQDERNLLYQSVLHVFQAAGVHTHPLRIKINNPIPLSRGLGSSGAAVVAGLVCANELTRAGMSKDDLLNLAVRQEGHPENVSASLLGGFTISCMTSHGVLTRRVDVQDEQLKIIVLIPDVHVSTQEARRALPASVTHKDAVFNVQRSSMLTYAFLAGDYAILRSAMQDRLHQSYRARFIPGFSEIERTAYDNGAAGFAISGSGSAIISFTVGDVQQLEASLQAVADQLKLGARTIRLGVSNEGAVTDAG